MAEPWINKPLTDEEKKTFEKLLDRGFTVYQQTNAGNTRIVVEKPRKNRKSR